MKFLNLTLIALALSACGDDDKKNKAGAPLNAPKVEPPVANNMPAAMKLWSGLALQNEEVNPRDGARDTVLGYMSTQGGNVSPVSRLAKVDERMATLDTRAQDAQRLCLTESAKDFAWPGSLPGSESFTLKFQCMDNLDGGDGSANSAQLAFGLDDTSFYLYERSPNTSVLAKAPLNGSSVEVFQIAIDGSSGNASWVHITGSDDNGVEIAYGGEPADKSQAMVCGVQVKTDGTLIYAKGSFYSGSCGDELTFCIDGATGDEKGDDSECVAAGLDQFQLTRLSPDTENIDTTNSKKFLETPITGITSINEIVEE